jgi:hypothetical protein
MSLPRNLADAYLMTMTKHPDLRVPIHHPGFLELLRRDGQDKPPTQAEIKKQKSDERIAILKSRLKS